MKISVLTLHKHDLVFGKDILKIQRRVKKVRGVVRLWIENNGLDGSWTAQEIMKETEQRSKDTVSAIDEMIETLKNGHVFLKSPTWITASWIMTAEPCITKIERYTKNLLGKSPTVSQRLQLTRNLIANLRKLHNKTNQTHTRIASSLSENQIR